MLLFCTFTFQLTSGLELLRMEQSTLFVVRFVRVKRKSPSKWLKRKKRKLDYEKFPKRPKSRSRDSESLCSSISSIPVHEFMNCLV